jgi:hypothetical protein
MGPAVKIGNTTVLFNIKCKDKQTRKLMISMFYSSIGRKRQVANENFMRMSDI